MTTDELILAEMLDRATNPSLETVDELSLQMFCMVVRSNTGLVEKAQEMIMSKIRSTDVTEATRAISLLEECMTKGGSQFQDEAAKFRFLNQLIRLVSKKYQGAETSIAIKQRIMECLLLWTTEFPQRSKIREVYDMLRKEGGIEHGNTPAAMAKRENVLGIDEEMLAKLIKSNDPENLKRANLLIQHRVNQEARRTEMLMQHKSVLQEVQNTMGLLNQMLDTYETDVQTTEEGNEDTVNLMRELFMACKKHKPILERLPELMENVEETLLADTIEANELLQQVMKRYKSIVVHRSKSNSGIVQPSNMNTNTNAKTTNAELLSELLGVAATSQAPVAVDFLSNDVQLLGATARDISVLSTTTTAPPMGSNPLDVLTEIFGKNVEESPEKGKYVDEFFTNTDLLEPVSVFPKANKESTKNLNGDANGPAEKRPFRELPDIDKLSEDLFRQSLQTNDRVGSFKKDNEKHTLNDLVKEKQHPKPLTQQSATPKHQTLPIAKQKSNDTSPSQQEDELVLSLDNESAEIDATKAPTNEQRENVEQLPVRLPAEKPVKHLSEISIDLDDVVPSDEPSERLLMDDDDMQLKLNFTENRPSRHVSVIVITACNKSKTPVRDFQFEASVHKPCKVRLLPASAAEMPPHKPFRPAVPINQMMLLLNPTGRAVDVTCIVSYKQGDDPDAIKESIVAKDIPYVE